VARTEAARLFAQEHARLKKPVETDVHLRVLEAFREHGVLPPAVLHRGPSAPARVAPSEERA
jgi:hypothetical protein